MIAKNNLTIIIPAFNEADNIQFNLPQIIDYCKQNEWQIIIVNDGSTDKTKEVLKTFEAVDHLKTLNHKLNKGYGAAIKTGIMNCDTKYAITIDADGQHYFEDIDKLYNIMITSEADMVVGSRKGLKNATLMRRMGKSMIRNLARLLMSVPVHDINSGMKIYRTDLAKKYLYLTPDTMAYSDIITLIFLNNRHLVLEEPIKIKNRSIGKSTIGIQTAFQTVMEIINIVILFNPMKIFLPISFLTLVLTLVWGVPLIVEGHGVSTGTLLGLISALIFFFLGLIAEQLSLIRRNQKRNDDNSYQE
jgi:glycosyltransferase involved in cell wall biosynthesis